MELAWDDMNVLAARSSSACTTLWLILLGTSESEAILVSVRVFKVEAFEPGIAVP